MRMTNWILVLAFVWTGCYSRTKRDDGDDGRSGVQAADPADIDAYARAAVVMGSCSTGDSIDQIIASMWLGPGYNPSRITYTDLVSCFASNHNGCDVLSICMGYTFERTSRDCEPTCQGAVFEFCGDGVSMKIDCGKLGMKCDPDANCIEKDVTSCDPSERRVWCDGGVATGCVNGYVRHIMACEDMGLACDEGQCIGKGEACNSDLEGVFIDDLFFGRNCRGSVLENCIGGRQHDQDCSEVGPGFSCQVYQGRAFCGVASECPPSGSPHEEPVSAPFCDGTKVVFCNAGRIERIDCKDLGFSGCDLEDARGCVPGLPLVED